MKFFIPAIIVVIIFCVSPVFGQGFTELKDGEDSQINGMLVSYSVVKKETKKGSDLYRLTATVTNQDNNYTRLFEVATDYFNKEPQYALAYFQFTNANGKALSSTSTRFYPKPLYISVPYKCKKCTPVKKDEDPYNHYTKSVIIGTQLAAGSTLSEAFNIRVPEGEIPMVRVMIY
jgi:hypothetical protein